MAQNYNVQINRFNGTDHDTLLPKNTITGTTDPTTSTKGFIGQFYANTSTNPAKMWQCVGESGGAYSWKEVVSSTTLITDRDPTFNDDSSNGFFIGRHLINTITGEEWICVDNTVGKAVWRSFQYDKVVRSIKIYGVSIDLTNSNPLTSVTYTDDAVGMTAGSSAWDSEQIFKDIKPCVLKNGVVQYYLNPADLSKKADGTASDITSGNDGDVMIEIPKTGFKITTVGNTLTIKVTANPNDTANFKYYAHTRAAEGDRSKLYIGAYLGYVSSSKLRSISGKAPTASKTIGAFRTLAKANGAGYDIVSFYPLTLLQCLFMIKYKNRDSQTALGRGLVAWAGAEAINTGGTNAKGIDFGETTGKDQMCFLNIEDMWGNLRWFIDGFFSNASRNMLTAFTGFNDTGAGYTDRGQGATSDIGNYMSKPQGTTEAGFVAKEVSGSATTHFTDDAFLNASNLPYFGGDWNDGGRAGVFCLNVDRAADYSHASGGARLMYL